MDITYLGAGSIKISGKAVNIVCDPYNETAGLGKLKTSADVVTLSGPGLTAEGFEGAMKIDGPGEYEVKESLITGIPARLHIDAEGERGTIYLIEVDEFRTAFVGNIAPKLSDEQLEALGQVDVLVVPVGGHGLTLDATGAAEIVSQLEPTYLIPTHFDDGKTKYPMPQDKLETFLKEMGATASEPQSKLKLTTKDVPAETTVVVLSRSGS